MSSCSICLSNYKDPVCIPCGHVYCKSCLRGHANGSRNTGLTAKCPDCRAQFHLTVPDLTYLPEKYHPFVSQPVRRVYVDTSSSSSPATTTLQNTVRTLETRLASKDASEEQLLRRCEELTAVLDAHRQGEREANERIMEMEDEMDELQTLLKKKGEKVIELEARSSHLLSKIKTLETDKTKLLTTQHVCGASNRGKEVDLKSKGSESENSGADNSSSTQKIGWSDNTPPRTPLKAKQPLHRSPHSSSDTRNVKAKADPVDVPFTPSPSPSRTIKPLPKRRVIPPMIGPTEISKVTGPRLVNP